ncbi:MAG: tetratricopeptide repeat protein [Alphaproteobacteria bacterium]|nr:tetratricopeptide repeat protein [Alphaproteobacteria bacterium]
MIAMRSLQCPADLTGSRQRCNYAYMAVRILLGLLALLWAPYAAVADQNDPRLDALFSTLQKTKDTAEAMQATQALRGIWAESPVPGAADELLQALLQQNAGNLRDAVDGYDQVIAAAPDFAEAYAQRAAVYYSAGLLLPAIADCEQALALEGRHFDVFAGLGQLYLALGDLSGAERAFAQALAINPHLSDVRQGLEKLKSARARREL